MRTSGEPVEDWMRRCILLADRARSSGESAVGAVVARDDELVAEAFESVKMDTDIAGHAELIAIRRACRALGTMDLTGCVLYTNVEPCWMCSFAIRETRIGQVVIGSPIADVGGATSRYPILSEGRIDGWGEPPTIRWQP